MKDFSPNHYERAFENFLIDNHIRYDSTTKQKRATFEKSSIKSFDFLLYPPNQQKIIAEIKGRKFKGTAFAKMTGFECWVTADDVAGLENWQKSLGSGHIAAFIFAYCIENVDVDFDGREVFDFDNNRYIFFAVKLDDYKRHMKRRSPKWETVTLPAENFRQCAVQLQTLIS
jgi:hypothetical protein